MSKKMQEVPKHELIPTHTKISDKEKKELYETNNISFKELPKIKIDDPAIAQMNLENGDVVKITRNVRTAGVSIYYRGVTNV